MNKTDFTNYLLRLEHSLLDYRLSDTFGRQKILENWVNIFKQRLEDDELELALLDMGQVTTILGYHQLLERFEHQDFFEILPDYYQMDLPGELKDYFEFGKPFTMRLKCLYQFIPIKIFERFREAQFHQLKRLGKEGQFDLFQLDINHPPLDSWYPIPIQMYAKFNNQSVDRVFMTEQGYFNLALKGSKYLLPGGGMLEKNLSDDEFTKLKKMLEEYLEEQRSDFYLVGQAFIAKISIEDFKQDLIHLLQDPFNQFVTMVQDFAGNPAILLQQLIESIDKCLKHDTSHAKQLLLHQLRAHLQVLAFRRTTLYQEALDYLSKHAIMVQIPMFLDIRVLGGRQTSNAFILTGMSLEQWFSEKLNCSPTVFGDDLAGASFVQLSFLQVIENYLDIKYSHVLIMLANVLLIGVPESIKLGYKSVLQKLLKDLQFQIRCMLV